MAAVMRCGIVMCRSATRRMTVQGSPSSVSSRLRLGSMPVRFLLPAGPVTPLRRSMSRSASCEDAYSALIDGTHLYLDCRSESEYTDGHPIDSANFPFPISDAGNVAPQDFLASVEERIVDKDTPIYVGCRSGQRSLAAIEVLRSAGYSNLTNVEGGFLAWIAYGFPSETGSGR